MRFARRRYLNANAILETCDFGASIYHLNWNEVRWRSWGCWDARDAEARDHSSGGLP
jgi:hypothetical protein